MKTTLADRCAAEVVDLHAAFERWFSGDGVDADLDRMAAVLAPGFRLIAPDGVVLDRDRILGDIAAGRASSPVSIRAEDPQAMAVGDGIVVVVYEERQERSGEATVRVSTAVMRDAPGTGPHGVEWLHVHETWSSSH